MNPVTVSSLAGFSFLDTRTPRVDRSLRGALGAPRMSAGVTERQRVARPVRVKLLPLTSIASSGPKTHSSGQPVLGQFLSAFHRV